MLAIYTDWFNTPLGLIVFFGGMALILIAWSKFTDYMDWNYPHKNDEDN
jgi:hypothetical protein